MSFSTTHTESIFNGDGSDSQFEVTFNYEADTEIKVQLLDYTDPDNIITTDLVRNSTFLFDTTTDLVTLVTGGVTPNPPTVDQKIRVYRETIDYHQNVYTDYKFPYLSVAVDFDRVYQRLQELKTELDKKVGLTTAAIQNGVAVTGEEVRERIDYFNEQIAYLLTAVETMQETDEWHQNEIDELYSLIDDLEERLDALDPNGTSTPIAGFSTRFSENFDTNTLYEAVMQILQITYAGPLISMSGSPTNSLREKGTVVASVALTGNTTKRTDPITAVRFYRNGVLIYTDPAPSADGSVDSQYTDSTPFSDTLTFSGEVDDGTTTGTGSLTYTFVYPYYYGADVPGLTAAQVGTDLTKSVIASTSSVNPSFTTSNGDVYYFAYPASYGALSSILDENNFETIGDWTLTTANITGLDGNPVSYRIYEFNNPVVAGSTDYTFIR